MVETRRLVAMVSVAHATVGAAVATAVSGPVLSADDVAYLGMARTIAGGGSAPIIDQPPYGVLYPVMLSPGWLVGLDEPQMLVYARLQNAALGAALVALLFVLLRRLRRDTDRRLLVAATIAASLPAALLHSSIVWTESLLPVLVVAGLVALARFAERPDLPRAAVVLTVAALQVAAHPRAVTVAAVLIATAAAVAARRRLGATALGLLTAAMVADLAIEAGRRWVQRRAFGSPGRYDAGDLASRRGLDDLDQMIGHGLGALAYLLLATAGLAAVGALVAWRTPIGRVALAMLATTTAMAGWFLTGVDRADAWLHGRYVEAVAAPFVALGLLSLRDLSRRQVSILAGVVVVAGVIAAWGGPGDNWADPRSPVMMLGVEPAGAPFASTRFEPGAAASVAVLVLMAGWWLVRRWPRVAIAASVAVIGVATWSGLDSLDSLYEGSVAGSMAEDLDGVAGMERLAIDATSMSPAVVSALAWTVGFDDATLDPEDPDATHLAVVDHAGDLGPGERRLIGAILVDLGSDSPSQP